MFNIDTRSNKPIYEQIIQEIKTASMKGILNPGDKLPSVRQLAVTLSINPNTVSKAYSELEREFVIETIRGKGTFICERQETKLNEAKLIEVRKRLNEVCMELMYLGLEKEAILGEVEVIIQGLKKGE